MSKKVSVQELIQKFDVNKITVQFLHQCLIKADMSKDGVTKVTFGSDMPVIDLLEDKKTAIIVWVEFEDFNNIAKQVKEDSNKVAEKSEVDILKEALAEEKKSYLKRSAEIKAVLDNKNKIIKELREMVKKPKTQGGKNATRKGTKNL